jgi:transcriptional regulator with XRE-family HTH domain
MEILKGTNTQYSTNEYQKCFVGYSHNAPWRDDIIGACETMLPKFGLKAWYADDQFKPTKSLRDKVVEMIVTARYGIYDLSLWRQKDTSEWIMPRNVLIELGMAIAFNRPILILCHAENRVYGLKLPVCLTSISEQIVEFSGEPTLKQALEKHLPQWINVPPEQTWLNRYCLFGQRVCPYREVYPQIEQWKQERLCCHISDGPDVDRIDFRSILENELERYSNVTYNYLDALPSAKGYDFLLCTHCQSVRSTLFAIYRITPQTSAETFIAIGMSIALETQFKCEIPKLLFTADAQDVPSLLKGYDVVEAVNSKERKARLRKFLPMVIHQVRESTWKPHPLPFEVFIPPSVIFPQKEADKSTEYDQRSIPGFRVGQEIAGVVVTPTDELRQKAPPDTKAFLKYQLFATQDVLIVVNDEEAQNWKNGETHLCLFLGEEVIGQCTVLKCEPRQSKRLLRLARESRYWSQQELADAIGTTPLNVGRWERGVTIPSPYFRHKLCEIFEKSPEELGFVQQDAETPYMSENAKKPEYQSRRKVENFSEMLERLRQERQISKKDLSTRAGLTASYVSHLTLGTRLDPSPETVTRLARALGLDSETRTAFFKSAGLNQSDSEIQDFTEDAQASISPERENVKNRISVSPLMRSVKSFTEVLEELRQMRQLSKRDLATRSGLSAAYVSHLTLGQRTTPSEEVVKALADALELGMEDRKLLRETAGYYS